jgi:hypothetical protein
MAHTFDSLPSGITRAIIEVALKFDGPVIPSEPHIPPNPVVEAGIPPNPVFPAAPSTPIVSALLGDTIGLTGISDYHDPLLG